MKQQLISIIVGILLKLITPELMKKLADQLLDTAEKFVMESENEIDDQLVLPLIRMLRFAFDIPDDKPDTKSWLPGNIV